MSFEPTGPIDRVANGQVVRRQVLGDEFADSISEPKTEAQAALQEMVAGLRGEPSGPEISSHCETAAF